MVELFEVGALVLVSLAAITIMWSTFRFGISPMPTSRAVLEEVLELIPREQTGTVHELGAGWGTIALALARRCPQLTVLAHEGSPFPFLICWLRARLTKNLEVRFGDFLKTDLRGATGVITYLWTGGMQQLAPKFEAELPPGAFVISHTFAWRGKTPTQTRTADDLYRTQIYRYVVAGSAPQ